MINLIDCSNEERSKYYYSLGMQLGRAINRKGDKIKVRYNKVIKGLMDNIYPDAKSKLHEVVELLIIAEIYIPSLDQLYMLSDNEKTKAVHSILNFAMKPIAENNE